MYGIHHHGPMCGPGPAPVHVGPMCHRPMCGPSIFGPRHLPYHGPRGSFAFHQIHAEKHAAKTIVGGGLGAVVGGILFGPVGAIAGGALGALVSNAACRHC